MNSKTVKNKDLEPISIEVIRYFSNNDSEYLIYSLNENDEAGYTKLYASKIIENTARMISNEEEWTLIKEIIKDVVKSNRDGNPLNIIDLNETNLTSVVLEDTRVFKLQGNLVNLLAENKKVPEEPILEDTIEEVEEVEEEILEETIEDEPVDYETLYHNEVNKVEELENRIEELEQQLHTLEQTMQQIRNLVQE